MDEQQSGFAARIAWAKTEPRDEVARRAHVVLRVIAVTLAWLVSLALLLGWQHAAGAGNTTYPAAFVAIFFPFVAAVIATRHHQFRLGGAFVVLTLVMVFPAMAIMGWF